jgi:succinate dehydrogenase flavin-adding protein (antitoxin of CptAB toxin-antitoxin module)
LIRRAVPHRVTFDPAHDRRFLSIARVTFDYLHSEPRTYTQFLTSTEQAPAAWQMTSSSIADAQRAAHVRDIQIASQEKQA